MVKHRNKGLISVEVILFSALGIVITISLIQNSYGMNKLIKSYEKSINTNLYKNKSKEEFLLEFVKEINKDELTKENVENKKFEKMDFSIEYNFTKNAFELMERKMNNVKEFFYYDYVLIEDKILLEKRGYYDIQ